MWFQQQSQEKDDDDSNSCDSETTMGGTTASVDLLLGFSQKNKQSSFLSSSSQFISQQGYHSKEASGNDEYSRTIRRKEEEKNNNNNRNDDTNTMQQQAEVDTTSDDEQDGHCNVKNHTLEQEGGETYHHNHPFAETIATKLGDRQDLLYDMSQLSQIPRELSRNNTTRMAPVNEDDDQNKDDSHQSMLNLDFIAMSFKSEFGMQVRRLSNSDIIVSDMKENSQAEKCGIKLGDIIYRAPQNCHCRADWDHLIQTRRNIPLQRYSVEDIYNLSKSMVRPALFVVKRSTNGYHGNKEATIKGNATNRQEEMDHHHYHCSLAKEDIKKALSVKNGKEQLGLVNVPCCRLCQVPSLVGSQQRHHFLCPKHQDFTHSGAKEKLIILLAGALFDCDACIYELEHGKKHGSVQHNAKCKSSSQVNKIGGKHRSKRQHDVVDESSSKSKKKVKLMVNVDNYNDNPHESAAVKKKIKVSGAKKDSVMQAKKHQEPDDVNGIGGTGSMSSKKKTAATSKSKSIEKNHKKQKGNAVKAHSNTKTTSKSEKSTKKHKLVNYRAEEGKAIQANEYHGMATSTSKQSITDKHTHDSCHINRHEKQGNVMHVTPVPHECHPVDMDKSAETIDKLPIVLTDDTTVPKWVPCPNPWGDRRYMDGDFVLYSPFDYMTASEIYGVDPKRFTMHPFKGDHYKSTHISPTEKGLDLIQLNRDRLGLRSWGFRFSYHDFGGACLVTEIEPMSPSDSGTILGTENEATRLYPNDMIIYINNRKVGGMTEIELGVELDLSGPELILAVSRYRKSLSSAVSSRPTSDVSTSSDIASLHWKEFGLENNTSFNNSQRVETFEHHIEQEEDESPTIFTLDQVRGTSPTSTKLNISTHFVDNSIDLKSKTVRVQNDEADNELEETKKYNNGICTTTNPVEQAVSHNIETDLSQQLHGDEMADEEKKRILRNLDFKGMPDSILPIPSSKNRSGFRGVEQRRSLKYFAAYCTSKEGRVVYGPFNDAIDAAKMYAWAYLLQHGNSAYQEALHAEERQAEVDPAGNSIEQKLKSLNIENLPSFIEPIKSNSPSGYKGVHLQGKHYHAQIYCENSRFKVGYYASKMDAARMYAWAYFVVHGQELYEKAQRQNLENGQQSKTSKKRLATLGVKNETDKKEEGRSTPIVIHFYDDSQEGKEEMQEVEYLEGEKGIENAARKDSSSSDETSKHLHSPFHTICKDSIKMKSSSKDTLSSSNNSKCTDDTDVEWECDSNPWLGCVCGETHEKPVPVFWIQCDSCDAWYNCSSSCIGFTKHEANKLENWMCPDCVLTENGIGNHDVNKVLKTVISPSGNNKKGESAIHLGSVVDVQDRTWVGSNKPGGVAKVVDVHIDHNDHSITYDVKYVLENRTEKNIESEYISLNRSMMDDFASPIRTTRVSGSARKE